MSYVEQHEERFLEELFDFLRIKSISTQPEHLADMHTGAKWVADHCRTIGMTHAEVMPTEGHPVVYAEWLEAGDAPTVLVYGHYDVQPAEASDGWDTDDPFEPVIRDGNIVARGATDDKGQMFLHLKAFETLMQTTGSFPVNIKMIFEGEEEAPTDTLENFIPHHIDLLKANVAVISDTTMIAPGMPAIPYGLRGYMLADLEISGPKGDLHSGLYGGAVHNPIHALSQLIATMHDETGRVAIAGFYDDVRALEAEERAALAQIPFTDATWDAEIGAPAPWGEPDYTLIERMGARPTLDVISMKGGLIGEGVKNIVPQKAQAYVSCRLVPHQDPATIFELLRQHVEKHTPPTVTASIRYVHGSPAVLIDRHVPEMQVAVDAYEQVFGKAPIFTLVGGSIPVVTHFQHLLGLPTILMGFGLPDDNLHAPNEKFALEQFRLGLRTLITFYAQLGKV